VTERPARVARLQVVGTAILFSTGGTAVKVADGMSGLQVACFRSAVAVGAIAVMVPASRRGWTWRTLLVGVAYAGTLIMFVTANKLTSAADAIFLQETALIYLLLIGPVFLRERLRPLDVVTIVVFVAAIGLFFLDPGQASDTATNPTLGNVLALGSGVGWACTLAGLRWLGRSHGTDHAAAAAVAGNLMAMAICLPFALPVAGGRSDWLTIVYLGVFQIGLAYALLTRAVRVVPAVQASLLLMIEPALSPVWAWIVHGERPGPWSLAGGAVIVVGTIIWSIIDARISPAAPAGRAATGSP
jgi:drug/metabolite transporter (DMT)-like permease